MKKLQGWKHGLLAQAGRKVLIKSITNTITMCPMTIFKFPRRVCEDMSKAISQFWWGQKEEENRIH